MRGVDLARLRAKLGLTQEEFAELLGLKSESGRHYISNLENGNKPISPRIEQTAKLLEKTYAYKILLMKRKSR